MRQTLALKTQLRPALLGRLKMAAWIEMPETEFASAVEELEKDPLFQKLFRGLDGSGSAIRRQPWPNSRLSGRFFELNEAVSAGGEPVQVEKMVEERAALADLIRRVGHEAFEKYFIRGDEALPLDEIARRTGLTLEEASSIHDFILELGSLEEFYRPAQQAGGGYACLAHVALEGGKPVFEFTSPHWARGLYQVRYELIEKWKHQGVLESGERRRVRHLLKRIETLNLRQSTLFRILESVTALQAEYLRGSGEEALRPMSLRGLARRLDLAPSTVSRAMSGRSVQLPWKTEVPLIQLSPGRRSVMRILLGSWLEGPAAAMTDQELAAKLRKDHLIKVSRRTVNAVRNELARRKTQNQKKRR